MAATNASTLLGHMYDPRSWSFGTTSLLVAVVVAVSMGLLKVRVKRKTSNLPPGPRSYPLIGHMLEMRGAEMPEKLWSLSQTNNWPIMSFIFPNIPTVIVSSPEVTKEMLITKGNVFNSRVREMRATRGLRMSPDGKSETGALFTPHGPAWKVTRKIMVAGQNEFKRILGHDYVVRVLLPQLYKEIDSEVSIDARHQIAKTMIVRILMVFVFGPGAEQYAEEIIPLNDQLFVVTDNNHAIETFLPCIGESASWLYNKLVARRLVARKRKAYEEILSQRGVKYNLKNEWSLSDMVQEAERNGEINHDQALEIYEECFFAGQDPTVAAVEGTLRMIVENPKILVKVQQEMDEVLGEGKQLRLTDVERLPYFQGVIKEGLRLHRAIPFLIPHCAHEDATLGGFDIPKNMMLLVNLWGLARDPASFPDPYEAKPERFLERDTNFSGNDGKYVVFGVGQRICPGQSMALFILNMVIGSMCQRYNLAVAKDWKHERDTGTFFKEVALHINLTRRQGFTP
ncbi:protein MpCYP822-like7 [Marchantia polymorpha subsp. ruderalis]|uniref:Cytochrome P450 n=2 Tax=Marchantia polymorpha TaxID=3197 RepID=A0AAF6BJF8_MARPO|nr:hypothetical protein MARPO_0084s0023 [Marchantia polymorpha]BBN12142.1 hypothetical protein Mp_5g17730 [Marchantia polymorpha subsp. ruderalis]|eukprot:PTQ33931.1 hypothetical protein MARPO_0084s0023 [Marchantia polymorpha]